MTRSSWGLAPDPFEPEEKRRDRLVRTIACPVCSARPGHCCRYERINGAHQPGSGRCHTGRYNVAAEQGLVPPLPKVAA